MHYAQLRGPNPFLHYVLLIIFSQMTEHKINMMEEHKTEIFKLIKTSGTISNITSYAGWQYENYMIRIAKTLMINPNSSKNGT